MSKVIVHIDLNAFFARAEEIKDPYLENKPVAIGHDGRSGIVSTCSYAARKYGVHSGMPMFKAKELCPQLIIKPVDFRYYGVLSRAFVKFVKRYTKIIEVASVDECYADFTDTIKGVDNPEKFFRELQDKLFQETKLKCSIGVGPTKFLAKMASDYQKPMGLTFIRRRDIEKILYPLPLKDMFGIGKKTAPYLTDIGIYTIGDLALRCNKDDEQVKSILGKFFYVIKDWINGYGSDEVETAPWDPKSIGNSSTLSHDTDNYEEIRYMFENLSKEVGSRAVKEDKIGSTIQIVVKDSEFKSHNKSISFDTPTNSSQVIYDYAMKLYENNFMGMVVRLVGVTLQNLIPIQDMAIQMSLFDYKKHEEASTTKLLINEMNRKLNKPLLKRAAEVKKKEKE